MTDSRLDLYERQLNPGVCDQWGTELYWAEFEGFYIRLRAIGQDPDGLRPHTIEIWDCYP